MKKLICCFSLACMGFMVSCVDKNEEVDADSKPEWLHGSIYETLQNPQANGLEGTFNNYLKLADDLGYAETLNRTGSKTVFPANDSAFARFFESNAWGVKSYDQLTISQKKVLFYSSMLNNALLTSMLSNMMNGESSVLSGMATRHETNLSVTDTITHIYGFAGMPRNNKYWTKFKDGIDVVYDNTTPMMVHFTREYMLNNNMTITGENSDFEILTGTPYQEGQSNVFVFGDQVIKSDITCVNGYIHQLKDVLVPPGNMAQTIREGSDTHYFSRMLDYFCAPYFDQATTNNYNDWATANGKDTKDSIYQVRYFSSNSQNNEALTLDPNHVLVENYLSYDPGWNQYYPKSAYSSNKDDKQKDMGAMFVPTDDAVKKYFLPGGEGEYLVNIYKKKSNPNDEEHLNENIDSIYDKNPQLVASFVKNLQQNSFINSVPSKFTTISNDAAENMGMNLDYLNWNVEKNKYDVRVSNNGVVYVINQMIVPDEYRAVLAPCSTYPDMSVMNWMVQDGTYLGVDFKYYLLAMSANYAFFIPDNQAFDFNYKDNVLGHEHEGKSLFNAYYVDPSSLGSATPVALRFYYDAANKPFLFVEKFHYDPATNKVGDAMTEKVSIEDVKTQLVDILNYHTVVLNAGETIGEGRHYYQTKHGGEIYISGSGVGGTVCSGAQIEDATTRPRIESVDKEKNGNAYRIDGIIQAPRNSVHAVLEKGGSRFSTFLELCEALGSDEDLMTWAGISNLPNEFNVAPQETYAIFTTTYGNKKTGQPERSLDQNGNVRFFNTYNYTLYAPNNDAMEKAFNAGLPRWSDVEALYNKYDHDSENVSAAEKADQQKAMTMITAIREFIRYHFQRTSIYADNSITAGEYATMHSNDLGIAENLILANAGTGEFTVTDARGNKQTINANGSLMVNQMARDYWLTNERTASKNGINTSSFCAVHEVSTPLYSSSTWSDAKGHARYDLWNEPVANAPQKAYQYYKRLNANNKY